MELHFLCPLQYTRTDKTHGRREKVCGQAANGLRPNLYDPENEPDIAYPYLFNYFKGEEWRTQKEINRLLAKYYKDEPDGIPDNDDCGTMSAWAILSMIGLYSDCPGSPYYSITAPIFDKVTLHLSKKYYPNGDITIEAQKTSTDAVYINGMSLGEKEMSKYRILHDEFIGGKLIFELSNKH